MLNIDFPLQFQNDGRSSTVERDDHIRNLIDQLLMTNASERVNRSDFGAGLQQMVFEPNSPELAATLQFTAQSALQHWLGDIIEVQNLKVVSEDSTLQITVQYKVLQTGEERIETFEGINI